MFTTFKYLFSVQMLSLGIEVLAWFSLVSMLGLETKIYISEFRWYVRFGLVYVLVADAVMFNLIFALRDFCPR